MSIGNGEERRGEEREERRKGHVPFLYQVI
jgi:hypothetical protein